MDRTCRAGSGLSGKKKIVLVVCLIVVALLVGYGILCGAAGRDVIYPHVTVEAVDLGGMTKEEAQAALEKAVQEVPLDETRGVVFTVSTDQGEIQTVEVPLSSVAIDCAATVERAWAVGRIFLYFRYIDKRSLGKTHISELLRRSDDVYHTSARYGNLSAVLMGNVNHLLDAMDV